MRIMFEWLKYYYPVFIPLFLAFLTVLQRIAAQKFEATLEGLLKIYTDLTLGLFAFILWAYGTPSFKTGRVSLNPDYYIDAEFINILLLFDIGLLVMGIFVARKEWPTPKQGRKVDTIMLLIAVFFVTIPLQIKKPESAVAQFGTQITVGKFDVAIPYKDDSLARHIGVQKWGDRLLLWYQHGVEAKDRDAAKLQALSAFRESGKLLALFPRRTDTETNVTVEHEKILVQQSASLKP